MNQLTKDNIATLNFEKMNGLVPAIIQDNKTKEVLMLGFMNEQALNHTLDTNVVTFYSRTKKRLWTKGEQSGNLLHVCSIYRDCDEDTLLIFARPDGPVCHLGTKTCFNQHPAFDLFQLEQIIKDRIAGGDESSYVYKLTNRGMAKVAQKAGEEAVEMVIEAMKQDNKNDFVDESADLLFHYLVLLNTKGFSVANILDRLAQRHQQRNLSK